MLVVDGNDKFSIDSGDHTITIDGNDSVRIFEIATDVDVELNELNLIDGSGILNQGELTLSRVRVRENRVLGIDMSRGWVVDGGEALGGGVANEGTLVVVDSVIYDNLAHGGASGQISFELDVAIGGSGRGGGLYNGASADLAMDRSTVWWNQAIRFIILR